MENQFTRTISLIGEDSINKLKASHVAIFGVGGVGGYVAEALARVGIGNFDLIDNDIINITNINRQIIALHSTIGKDKIEVAKERILDINPNAKINTFKTFFSPENSSNFDFSKYDYVVDAIDTVSGKIAIIEKDVVNNIDYCQPFIYYFDYNNANKGKPTESMLMYMKSFVDITSSTYIRRNPYEDSCYETVSNKEGETFFKLHSDALYEDGRIVEYSKYNSELLGIYFDILSVYFIRLEELDYEVIDPYGEKATNLFLGISLDTLREVLFNNLKNCSIY